MKILMATAILLSFAQSSFAAESCGKIKSISVPLSGGGLQVTLEDRAPMSVHNFNNAAEPVLMTAALTANLTACFSDIGNDGHSLGFFHLVSASK